MPGFVGGKTQVTEFNDVYVVYDVSSNASVELLFLQNKIDMI